MPVVSVIESPDPDFRPDIMQAVCDMLNDGISIEDVENHLLAAILSIQELRKSNGADRERQRAH